MIPHFEDEFGTLDHEFVDPKEGSSKAAARVVPAGGRDSVSMFTLVKPPAMLVEAFREGIGLVEEELQAMKRILEAMVAGRDF